MSFTGVPILFFGLLGERKDMEERCHLCGELAAEFYCTDCELPVCEDCCVMPTYHNMIDYTLCNECGDSREAEAMKDREREWKAEAERKAKKEKIAAVRKVAYWKPENVAKRSVKKEALLLARKEQHEKQMKETVRVVASMFRGMF